MGSPKNPINTQFGRVSDDDGIRINSAGTVPEIASENDGLEPLLDNQGRLIVRIADGSGFIPSGITENVTGVGSNTITDYNIPTGGLQVIAGPSTIVSIIGFAVWCGAAVPTFIHLFNDIALVSGVTRPKVIIPVNTDGYVDSTLCDWIARGDVQFNGLVIGLSSVPFTYTALTARFAMVNLTYRVYP